MTTHIETCVAETMRPMLAKLLGDPLPVDFDVWDGSTLHHNGHAARHTVCASSLDALRHIAWAPGELGFTRAYVCSDLDTTETSPADAQAAKHELTYRKLGLAVEAFRNACEHGRPRVLDVGCGWGSMALHAAAHHDVDVVGITTSTEQANLTRRRAAEARSRPSHRDPSAGLPGGRRRAVRRDLVDRKGEHVGAKNMVRYLSQLYGLVRDGGRVLNHAIASVGGSRLSSRSFVGRHVLPNGGYRHLAHRDRGGGPALGLAGVRTPARRHPADARM